MTRVLFAIGWLLALGAGVAQAQGERIAVGLYIPDLAHLDRTQRLRAIQSLAAYLSDTTGLAVEGRAFSRGADVVGGGGQRGVDYAIAPAYFVASMRWTPVLTLERGGARAAPWVILAGPPYKTVGELQGKTVALPRVLARSTRQLMDQEFVAKVLLEGEVDASYFQWVFSPDAPSAVEAVKLGKASAAVVAKGPNIAGLSEIFSSRPVPLHALAVVNDTVADTTTQAIKRALLGWKGSWLDFSGWAEANPAAITSLRAQMMGRTPEKKPVVFRPALFTLGSRDVVRQDLTEVDLPSPLGIVRAPIEKPDASF